MHGSCFGVCSGSGWQAAATRGVTEPRADKKARAAPRLCGVDAANKEMESLVKVKGALDMPAPAEVRAGGHFLNITRGLKVDLDKAVGATEGSILCAGEQAGIWC